MLKTNILGMNLSNPLFLAAGILGTTASSMKMVSDAGAGGIVTKSFSIESNDGYDNPTIIKIEGGVINSVGLASPGVEAKKEELKQLNEIRSKTPVIASIYGDSEEVFSQVALQTKDYVDAFELNVSCPHAKCGYGSNIGENPETTYNIVSAVKDTIKDVPIIVKLTPNVTDITTIAMAAQEANADALTLINSVGPGLRIDYKTAKPILNNIFGGISGPMIKPIALKCVYKTYQTVDIPIFGVGGIKDYKDALEFLYAGASILQVGTSIMYTGPEIFKTITDDLTKFMEENSYKNLEEIIGLAHEQ
ncbi:MAG: dihydroorotate dehydrogenase B catalytic subunit [Methanosphaera sp. rholeuAM74]|nr:MAG: dihydroorotate dehydrogenase B catalytic subunit [Methanosphaera sp. rholeuAM74]